MTVPPGGGGGCNRRRHSCTSATCFSQRMRFCQPARCFLSKTTLKTGKLEFEAHTQVHFWFWSCSCFTVTYHSKGWTKNSDILDTLLICWILFALCKYEIVFMFPECLKHWATDYYFMFIIITIVFPSIQNLRGSSRHGLVLELGCGWTLWS